MNDDNMKRSRDVRSIASDRRITAEMQRTERGDVRTEYRLGGRTYTDLSELASALRGEGRWD